METTDLAAKYDKIIMAAMFTLNVIFMIGVISMNKAARGDCRAADFTYCGTNASNPDH